jgi:hypothetical protein
MTRCPCLLTPVVIVLDGEALWCPHCDHPISAHEDAGGCTRDAP